MGSPIVKQASEFAETVLILNLFVFRHTRAKSGYDGIYSEST